MSRAWFDRICVKYACGGIPVTLTATPEIKNNRGVLGVTRSNQPGDVKVESRTGP